MGFDGNASDSCLGSSMYTLGALGLWLQFRKAGSNCHCLWPTLWRQPRQQFNHQLHPTGGTDYNYCYLLLLVLLLLLLLLLSLPLYHYHYYLLP